MKKKLIAIIAALSVLLSLLVGYVVYMEWNRTSEAPDDTEGSSGQPTDQNVETEDTAQATDAPTEQTENVTGEPSAEPTGETTLPAGEETTEATGPSVDPTTEPTEETVTVPEDTTPEITFPENDTHPTSPATEATGDAEYDPEENATPELEL